MPSDALSSSLIWSASTASLDACAAPLSVRSIAIIVAVHKALVQCMSHGCSRVPLFEVPESGLRQHLHVARLV